LSQISNWETAYQVMLAEYEQLCRLGLWRQGPSDLLGLIGRGRRETYHSALIAWLLTPTGGHGLGTRLLSTVLLQLFPSKTFSSLSSASVECEVYRPNPDTRADIIVWGSSFTLIIENKIDAGEQANQCDRIYGHFSKEKNAHFCFLTPSGHPPTTDTSKQFKCLSYISLRSLLEAALEALESNAPGRATASNYLQTLRREFP
jgi:hypothetical protein